MRTKKILSLLLSVALILSFATVAYAAPVAVSESEAPTVYVEIGTVTKAGKAAVDIYYNIDAELAAENIVEDEETLETLVTGKGILTAEIIVKLNSKYFDLSTQSPTAKNGSTVTAQEDGSYNVYKTADSPAGWLTTPEWQMVRITADIVDEDVLDALGDGSTTELKDAAKNALNAKTDLVSYSKFNTNIGAYPAAGATTSGLGSLEYLTEYRLDGKGHFVPVTKTGADAPAPVDPTIKPDNGAIETDGKADAKTWAVAVDGGYVAAGDVLVATLTNNGDTQVVNLTVGDNVVGGADWAFNLKVRFKDVAQRAATTLAIAKAN